ncbi:MAG TPA: HAD-IA family hydrolase [Thermoleophilaceae bacterium]|jgi:putative hydrolase of the HAD superfamily
MTDREPSRAGAAGGRAPRAVLLDALGTLVAMEPPAPRLVAELGRRGHRVEPPAAEAALAAEIAYYREHHLEGRDAASLDGLRDRCAEVLRGALALPGLARADARDALLASIRFRAHPDAAPCLAELRRRGLRLVVASNWDCSLHRVLEEAGLAPLVDGTVASAEAGAAKPDARLFRAALELAGVGPGDALHVGDSAEADAMGARAAGIAAVLLRRDGAAAPAPAGVPAIASLAELPALL